MIEFSRTLKPSLFFVCFGVAGLIGWFGLCFLVGFFFFTTFSKEERLLNIGSSFIVKAIKSKHAQCCGLFHSSLVCLGSSCLPLEGHCPVVELPLATVTLLLYWAVLLPQEPFFSWNQGLLFSTCGICFTCVNVGGDENGQADNPEISPVV